MFDFCRHIPRFDRHHRTDALRGCGKCAFDIRFGAPADAQEAGGVLVLISAKIAVRDLHRTAPTTTMISRSYLRLLLTALFAILVSVPAAWGQSTGGPQERSQEYSEGDEVPVLIKHLPDWQSVEQSTRLVHDVQSLKDILGDRAVLDLVDFTAGTEAVTASYPAGRLLIVEYSSPQASVDADAKFTAVVAGDANTAYRRIGNYNVLVFDAADPLAANTLIDQVKYEKNIQWLGDNPFHISAERAFVLTTSDIFLSTLKVILMGIGFAIVGGLLTGYAFFMFRERRRAAMPTFSDAGGMTRLNLDGFTPDIMSERLLGE